MTRPTHLQLISAALVLSTAAVASCGAGHDAKPDGPATGPAAWLVTTHSGNDVLTLTADGHAAVLVAKDAGGLAGARGVAVGPGGDLFVASSEERKGRILRFARDGTPRGVFAAGGGMAHPYEAEFGPAGDLFVSGQDDDAVSRYDGKTGQFKDTFVPAGSGGLDHVRGFTFAPGPDGTVGGGDLLVASRDTDEVLRYDRRTGKPKGAFVAAKAGDRSKPTQAHFGPDGNLYVGSSGTHAVLRYDGRTGAFVDAFVPAGSGGLKAPAGFAFSAADGDLYVASRLSDQILRYDGHTGKFKAVVAAGEDLKTPEFLVPLGK